MANTMPPEARPIATSVPMRASSTATQPLAQPVSVGPMGSPAATQPATPITPVADNRRQRPSTVSNPSGATSGYPSGTNAPAGIPGGPVPRRGQ
jgi:hypothetical protein